MIRVNKVKLRSRWSCRAQQDPIRRLAVPKQREARVVLHWHVKVQRRIHRGSKQLFTQHGAHPPTEEPKASAYWGARKWICGTRTWDVRLRSPLCSGTQFTVHLLLLASPTITIIIQTNIYPFSSEREIHFGRVWIAGGRGVFWRFSIYINKTLQSRWEVKMQ